ncbi:MAG: hypothetical protein MJD61_16400 [Proteobacteria bacterium]|nr:hypothetical protein [Pseudomonadota bacterium]
MRAIPAPLAGSIGLLLLVAATPGSVGSCGREESLADLHAYCPQREGLICHRRLLRHEFATTTPDDFEYRACRARALGLCQRRFWAPGCRPTRRAAQSCLNALSSFATLDRPAESLPECSTLTLCRGPAVITIDAGAAP